MSVREAEPPAPEQTYRQLRLKIWHAGCWTLDVTGDQPGTHIIEKSLHSSEDRIIADLILKTEANQELDQFIESIGDHDVIEDVTVLKKNSARARVIAIYKSNDSIVPEIVNSTFMPIEPVHVTGGHEYWTVLARADRLNETLENLRQNHNVDVMAINEVSPSDGIVFTDFVDEIYDTLSDRQLEALLTAKREGYYSWPREVNAQEVAEEFGVTGPTFLEHLRKAECKMVVPLLEEIEEKRSELHYLDQKSERY